MEWYYVVVVYESSGREAGYLKWSFTNVRWEMVTDRSQADRWRSESAAISAREEELAEGSKPVGHYLAVELRRF